MATNIEIKAEVRDFEGMKNRATMLSGNSGQVIDQEDVFFLTPKGRLKLRILAPNAGQLIYYEREDQQDPRPSEYFISQTDEPATLRKVLTEGLGVRGIVRKRRLLYWVENTRVHLDQVEGLGTFLELEVVLKDRMTPEDGTYIANHLMAQLGIEVGDLVEGAYIDLMEAASPKPAK